METNNTKKCLECGKDMNKPQKYSQKQWESKKYCNFVCWGKHQEKAMIGSISPMKGKHMSEVAKVKSSISHQKPDGVTKIKGYYTHKALERYARLKGATGTFTLNEWETLKAQYDYCCAFCSTPETMVKLTKDHIIPLTKGGSNYIHNIQPLCQSCNSRKHNKILVCP